MTKQWGRTSVIFTLFTGILLHATRLIVGPPRFQELFTPLMDAVFTVPIIVAIIGMIVTWRVIAFRNKWEYGAAVFTLGYFIISMPLHLQTWFTGNVDYIGRFPWWYSLVFISYSTVLIVIWWRFRLHKAS